MSRGSFQWICEERKRLESQAVNQFSSPICSPQSSGYLGDNAFIQPQFSQMESQPFFSLPVRAQNTFVHLCPPIILTNPSAQAAGSQLMWHQPPRKAEVTPVYGAGNLWYCEPCDKEFHQYSAFNAHMSTHEKCRHPDCKFSASKKVVIAHFHSTHGAYSGSGFKTIDVEGQKFKVLLGSNPSEIELWRSERRKRFPTKDVVDGKCESRKQLEAAGGVDENSSKKRMKSSSESACSRPVDGSSIVGMQKELVKNSSKKVCSFFARGHCKRGNGCLFLHCVSESNSPDLQGCGPSGIEKRVEKPPRRGKLILPPPFSGGERGTLLKQLLNDEIGKEVNVVLQCLRFICNTRFFNDNESFN